MPFVGIEAFDPKRIIYFLSREQELKTDEWCMFKFLGEWEIGKIKFCVEKEHPGEETKIRKATLADLEEFEKRKVIAKKAKEFAIEKIKESHLYKIPSDQEKNYILLHSERKGRLQKISQRTGKRI